DGIRDDLVTGVQTCALPIFKGGQGAAVARGVAIGVPLLALFGGLFVAADAVFKSLLLSAVPDLRHLWLRVLLACGIAWLSAGLRSEERRVGKGWVSRGGRRV